jgi:DNA repair ATPase RecN
LDPAGRIEEISRMISGTAITDPVRASARLMLGIDAKGKQKAKGESESR